MVNKIMRALNCSEEEAQEIIAADAAINRGERMPFDLTKEEEKAALKLANAAAKGKIKEKSSRKPKQNPEKEQIIAEITEFLKGKGYENVQILNISRQISLKIGENSYELTLIQKRKD